MAKKTGQSTQDSLVRAPTVFGHVDRADEGVVMGWAFRPDAPEEHLTLQIMVDESLATECTADLFRRDLLEEGIGDGRHAFSARLPASFLDDREHVIQVIESGSQLRLSARAMPATLRSAATIRGYLESVSGGALIGWALSPEKMTERLLLNIIIDGDVVMSAFADLFRGDLLAEGLGDGHYGFSAQLPGHFLDGLAHRVEVIEAGTGEALSSTFSGPVVFNPAEPPVWPFHEHDLYFLFDAGFYRQQAGEVENPLAHYMDIGWKRNFDPHPLFSTKYYIDRYGPEIRDNPLLHFFATGRFNRYHTHPLFDPDLYLAERPDVVKAGLHPLLHYLSDGWKEGPVTSCFFDEAYYDRNNPGIREAGFIPLVHYICFGWREGRKPHADFDPMLFSRLAALPKNIEPLTHFAMATFAELATARDRRDEAAPRISILILNLAKFIITLQCLYFLRAFTDLRDLEIIILDNGSPPEFFAMLCKLAVGATLLRVGVNRGFGEGNNIAAEAARGRYLLFLNNDAFVRPGWLPPLLAGLENDPTVGAAGPKFFYPDGRLQEAGAMLAPCGTAVQRGKYLDGGFDLFDTDGPATVDYCSAACLLVRAASFRQVLGFDLCWDPAYYEDADLCLKLRLIGQRTIYVPDSSVVHVENGTSSDTSLDLRLHDIVGINRLKFVSRWGSYLAGASDGEIERHRLGPVSTAPVSTSPGSFKPLPRLGLYTPYPLTPGGGERYLLTMAAATLGYYNCTLFTPDRYSRVRLATMARELQLSLDHVRMARIEEAASMPPFDVFVAMGNEILPSVHGIGRSNFYHCQFPFPLRSEQFAQHWDKLHSYDAFIVNSEFTRRHLQACAARIDIDGKHQHVLYPPVPQIAGGVGAGKHHDSKFVILNVGRFAPGGHCKRQDVMIEGFKTLCQKTDGGLELHLAGALGGDSSGRDYLAALQKAARGFPVHFHINVSPDQIHALYQSASVYWHLTGIGSDATTQPELFEHFGITICEAMSAGVIPVVLKQGGPTEIITDGWDGFLIANLDELLRKTELLMSLPSGARHDVSVRAIERAAAFSTAKFGERLLSLIGVGSRV